MKPHEDNVDAAPVETVESGTETMRQRLNRHARMVWDHVWGPTGSVILHIIIFVLLLRFVTGITERRDLNIEVVIMDPETANLDELKKELERVQDIDVQITMPDADITMERPPEVTPTPQAQQDFAELNIRANVQSPLIMRGLFAGRTAEGRAAMGRKYGGRTFPMTEAAVLKALEWLKDHQLEDGSWQGEGAARSKTAMTGLALLCFLAHGETPSSERYGPTVEKAIRFLVEQDWARDRFRNVDGNWYAHGIATYALCEAYALTRIPGVKTVAEQALARILAGQQETGAFNYKLKASDTRRDTSVMGWMNQAMKAGYLAGLDVPGLKEAMEKGANGFKINFDPNRQMFAYAPGGDEAGGGRLSNTCMAVLCLQLLGHGGSPEARAGFESMKGMSADYNNPSNLGSWPLYVWYYATQAHFHTGGRVWEDWNNVFARSFVAAQNADGSWTPIHGREKEYGPVYATSFCALTLMVYYRFLPTYQPIQIEEAPTEISPDDIRVEVSLLESGPSVKALVSSL